jgi:hypothetical protein
MLTRKASFGGHSSRCSLAILEKIVPYSAAKNHKNLNPTREEARIEGNCESSNSLNVL